MKTAIAGAIIAVLLPVAAAHADSADDQYLKLLSSHGVTGPADQLIADGHQACDAYGQGGFGIGVSPRQLALINLSNTLQAQGYSQHDASQIVLDATRTYCPQFAPPQ